MARGLSIAAVVACAVATATATHPVTAGVGLPHVRIDVEARTVELDCRIVLTRGPVELLLCLTGTKEHESILATDARPSHVHAALLALGIPAGRPGRWTPSATGDGLYLPPAGAAVHVELQYADRTGRRRVPAATWIRSARTPSSDATLEWVFVGSSPSPGPPYPADLSGEIISVANFPRAVIDVPFASTTDDELLWFEAATDAIGPVGAAVTVILHTPGDVTRAPVARAVFEIDRFGRYALDGLTIGPDRIVAWAERFAVDHARPYIVVYAAPRSLAADLQRLRDLLSAAGIEDVEIHTPRVAGPILPRTGRQAAAAIGRWQRRLARANPDLTDPAEQAGAVLRQIETRREELADLLELWDQYKRRLAESLHTHSQTTADREPAP